MVLLSPYSPYSPYSRLGGAAGIGDWCSCIPGALEPCVDLILPSNPKCTRAEAVPKVEKFDIFSAHIMKQRISLCQWLEFLNAATVYAI